MAEPIEIGSPEALNCERLCAAMLKERGITIDGVFHPVQAVGKHSILVVEPSGNLITIPLITLLESCIKGTQQEIARLQEAERNAALDRPFLHEHKETN